MDARTPKPLRFHLFGADDPLSKLADHGSGRFHHASYLRSYLGDLGVTSVVEEPYYFDRDYLSEFASFYGASVRGYPNVCRRLSFFSQPVARDRFERALGDQAEGEALQAEFQGFVVLRPLAETPFGRTVVRWYPDGKSPKRVMGPSRDYVIHIAGLRLALRGLAWQQQDSAVGACATVALWSMLHSSAFDEHHAVPTTADITRAANRSFPIGRRVFPSRGLAVHQICEAVKEQQLAPDVLDGDLKDQLVSSAGVPPVSVPGFSQERFGSALGTFIRSGYAVYLSGKRFSKGQPLSGHAVTAVGFRPGATGAAAPGSRASEDGAIECVYIHDDNVGPGVRMRVTTYSKGGPVVLERAPPTVRGQHTYPDPTAQIAPFLPQTMVAAVHHELQLSSDRLGEAAVAVALRVAQRVKALGGVVHTSRFVLLRHYLGAVLAETLDPSLLSRVRLELVERVPPMSLHLGVIRIGVAGRVFVDLLCDTSGHEVVFFAHVAFDAAALPTLESLRLAGALDPGVPISGF